MKVLGLTGSIAMGKSTITQMFADKGIPTTNADAIVHALLATDKKTIEEVRKHFPNAFENGSIHRKLLGAEVFGNVDAMKTLEQILHPRVRAAEMAFVLREQKNGAWLVVLDIPLLYETGADARVDKVLVVTAAAEEQQCRALARPDMTPEKLEHILARQMPDAEKRKRADFVVETDKGLDHSRLQVQHVLEQLKQETMPHA
jgi:dephospho-CoA kinase